MNILHLSRNLDDTILKEKFDALAWLWMWYTLARWWMWCIYDSFRRGPDTEQSPYQEACAILAMSGCGRFTIQSHSTHDPPCIKNSRWINRDRFAPWLPALVIIATSAWLRADLIFIYIYIHNFNQLINWRCALSQAKSPDLNPVFNSLQICSWVFFSHVFNTPVVQAFEVLSVGHASALLYVMLHLTGNGLGGPYDSWTVNGWDPRLQNDMGWVS